MALVLAPPLTARSLRHDRAGAGLAATAWAVSLATLALVVLHLSRASAWSGLVQRLLIGLPLLWLAGLSLRLLRR